MIKILFLSANPSDTARLRLDEEIRGINQALGGTEFQDKIELKQHWSVRVSEIQQFILRHQPDIVHFSGHGSEQGEIILLDNAGASFPVSVYALEKMFAAIKRNIQCVVLNACYSESQAKAIARHINCVIGIANRIEDTAAICFAIAFYQGLGLGSNVKMAFESALAQMELENHKGQELPQLIATNCDPSTVTFVQTHSRQATNGTNPRLISPSIDRHAKQIITIQQQSSGDAPMFGVVEGHVTIKTTATNNRRKIKRTS